MGQLSVWFLTLLCAVGAWSWSMDDFPLFDLVEEVQNTFNSDFYTLYEVSRDATPKEIKKAYRKLSLIYHPDKSEDENASEKFRQIAEILEVLKDEEKRQKYHEVLDNGLPDWRQPIWYFRRVRKMPWWETLLLILLIVTIGHYLMLWGSYFEKRLALTEVLESRYKRKEKMYKRKFNVDVDDLIDDHLRDNLEKPRAAFLLPVLICKFMARTVVHLPETISSAIEAYRKSREPEIQEEEEVEPIRRRTPAVRQEEIEYEVATDLKPVSTFGAADFVEQDDSPDLSGTLENRKWGPEEISQLIRLSSTKFPVGTTDRWEKIAQCLKRKPADITAMIGKLKQMDQQEYQRLAAYTPKEERIPAPDSTPATEEIWTQAQQKQFEAALSKFPKGVDERWEKISAAVPGKSKEECLARFKYLAQMVRNRKNKQEAG